MAERGLLIDASAQGELRLALIAPGEALTAAETHRYDARELLTFTDALIRFERETGVSLLGKTGVLAVAGATTGNILSIARSSWVISRSGLSALFGRPVAVFNDVAAQAWATLDGIEVRQQFHGSTEPMSGNPGCSALLTIDEGVGAALINVDRAGHVTVIETELGHTEFTITDAADEALCASLGVSSEQPSWEDVLLAAFVGHGATGETLASRARLVGRFVGNATLAFGAWNGVMVAGRHAVKLAQPGAQLPFMQGYHMRRRFRRQLDAAPSWIVHQHDPVMTGLAKLLSRGEQVAA